jgi:SAM-dependent methyltransferase
MATDSKERFSNRVENYVKFRPDYPREILAKLRDRAGLSPAWVVADIGSGTGISARMMLENGNDVFAVEPNGAMRAAAEKWLGNEKRFYSVDAPAEQTTLSNSSIDLIVSAQAFHWFDAVKCKIEFTRILKPGGWCALIWNERKTSGSDFLESYEALLKKYSGDYMAVRHERVNAAALAEFFSPGGFETLTFSNEQLLDPDGLVGRCLSSSYAPAAGDPRHEPMLEELRAIFARCSRGGTVAFEYQTQVHLGKLGR